MKKHIFGFVLFGFIVVSFALVYMVFNAPLIPKVEEVKLPIYQQETQTERPIYCSKKMKGFSYYVVSSQYSLEKNKLISKITLFWKGNGEAPKKISVQPRIFTLANYEQAMSLNAETFIEPFKEGNSKTIVIESKFIQNGVSNERTNFYVVFDFLNNSDGTYLTNEKATFSDANQVLLDYGESSVIKRPILRGTSIPQ